LQNILAILPSPVRQEIESAKTLDKESVSFSVKKNKIEVEEELSF
jgi:hypothetical protein